MKFRLETWADIVEVFRAGNPKKHHTTVQWSSSAFQWAVGSWAFSNLMIVSCCCLHPYCDHTGFGRVTTGLLPRP